VTYLRLQYRSKMGYVSAKYLPRIPDRLLGEAGEDLVISLRKAESLRPDLLLKRVSAITRLDPGMARTVSFVGVHADSALAPLWIWDVAHALPVGGSIRFIDDPVDTFQLERKYFIDAFRCIERKADSAHFVKEAALPAEAGSLDEWTFGIPVGPEDATLLNVCVKRILELDVPKKEILLCGRPADNFRYWDHVRVVGEDITAPPVQICRKKNRIAQEARYENLCIIHDRVFLPHNFHEAVQRFGGAFPLTGFQSLYFDDKWNLAPRRYSDFGVSLRLATQTSEGLSRSETLQTTRYAASVFPRIETAGFLFANAHRLSRNTYPTGSLYLVKRSVWQSCPQDENLHWIEFEDVEHGERAASMGIPSRVNPYGLTQSMISRPILSVLGAAHVETSNGMRALYRSPLMGGPWPRKPLIKKTKAQAVADMARFVKTWVPNGDIGALPAVAIDSRTRLRTTAIAVNAVMLPLRRDVIERFIGDYE
jgi:hypothetical protein